MRRLLNRCFREEDGVLSFEWTLLVTLLCLGVVSGLVAARDAVIDELGDAAQAMLCLDNSYSIDWPLQLEVDVDPTDLTPPEVAGLASDSSFIDAFNYTDCARATMATAAHQSPIVVDDNDS